MGISMEWKDIWGSHDEALKSLGHSDEYIKGYHDALQTFYNTQRAFFGRD